MSKHASERYVAILRTDGSIGVWDRDVRVWLNPEDYIGAVRHHELVEAFRQQHRAARNAPVYRPGEY